MSSLRWENNLDWGKLEHAPQTGGEIGLKLATEHVRGVSDTRVPLEEGTLERSGFPSVDDPEITVYGEGDSINTEIAYKTPYARYQHEKLSLRHPNGRQAKYLESAVLSEAGTAIDIIGEQIRHAI